MKNLFKFFFAIVACAATFAGCSTDDTDGGNPTPSNNFRVAAYATNSSDATSVTWSSGDEIIIAKVDDNGAFVSSSIYEIDSSTIAQDGNYAEFLGSNLSKGVSYIAYKAPAGGAIESGTGGFECYYEDRNDSDDLVMQSASFEYDGTTTPEIDFYHKSTILELSVKTSAGSYSGSITSINISSTGSDKPFLTTLLFDSTGAIVNSGDYGATSYISANAGVALSTSTSTIKIPVTWSAAVSSSVTLQFEITTTDFGTSSVTQSVAIEDCGKITPVTLAFSEPVASVIPANEVWYTTTDGKVINELNPNSGMLFDVEVTSNTYSNGKGILLCNSAVTAVNADAFRQYTTLRTIVLPEGLTSVGMAAFESCTNLEYVTLPSSLTELGWYPFMWCPSIKRFEGDCDLIFDDRYAIGSIFSYLGEQELNLVAFANGAGLTSYTIPESVVSVQNYSFYYAEELKELTFPAAVTAIGLEAFEGTYPERIYGDNVISNRSLVVDKKLLYIAPGGLKSYTTPAGVTSLNGGIFGRKPELEEIVISDEVTETDIYMSLWFEDSPNIESITISAAMKSLNTDPFGNSRDSNTKFRSIYLRAPIPPTIGDQNFDSTPNAYPNLTIYVPKDSYNDYMMNPDWESYSGYMKAYDYGDLSAFDDGSSVDYSAEGEVVTIQSATKGKGVNIVILGDGFDDTTMEDNGDYITRMKEAMECYFTEEPNKTLRDYYNIYTVKAVSRDSEVDDEGENNTAFSAKFGDGAYVYGNDSKAFRYALKVPKISSTQDLTVLVIVNSDRYAGTCFWYDDNSAVAYVPITDYNNESFRQVIVHEMGHAFGKLMDEYCYEGMGTVAQGDLDLFTIRKEKGWAANVDSTNDRATIQWAHMLSDTRYDGEVSVVEGGLTYEYGVWRPTENSIMRYNTGDFNAPSREAIYKRVMELAGETYSYEKFVTYDAQNIEAAIEANQSARSSVVDMSSFTPLAPPVYIARKPNVTE